MNYKGKRVIVLGGGGAIGRRLIRRLIELGAICTSVGGFSSQTPDLGCPSLDGRISSLLLATANHVPDVIFHVAGGSSVFKAEQNPQHDFELTVGSTLEVLEYIRATCVDCCLVYVSSAAVYGQAKADATVASMPIAPVSHYGLHKQLAESMCRFYARERQLHSVIVRPYSVYGPGMRKQLLWDALVKADKGELSFFGSGNEIRDWVFVDDLVALLCQLPDHADTNCPEFDAGTGTGVTIRHIIEQLLRLYDTPARPMFIGREKPGDPHSLVAQRKTLHPAVLSSLTTKLETGLADYVRWYRKLA